MFGLTLFDDDIAFGAGEIAPTNLVFVRTKDFHLILK